jgi:hypothetical protein
MKLANLAHQTPLLMCKSAAEVTSPLPRTDSARAYNSRGELEHSGRFGAASSLDAAAVPAIKIEGKMRVLNHNRRISLRVEIASATRLAYFSEYFCQSVLTAISLAISAVIL